MKKINLEKIKETVAIEYKSAIDWCYSGNGRYYMMRLNIDTGDIWADLYLSENNWTERDPDIIRFLSYPGDFVTQKEYYEAYEKEAVDLLTAAGWTL